jgi:lipoyl(octanoyl) transferase
MIQYLYLGRVSYDEGLRLQAELAELRFENRIENVLLLLEHPPVLTLGRNADRAHVLASDEALAARGVTVHEINRGGDVTYHGPGQLVGYPIFDLRSLRNESGGRMGPVDFVRGMEEALIRLCGSFGVRAGRVAGLTGVWCGIGSCTGSGTSISDRNANTAGAEQATEKPAPAKERGGFVSGHDFSRAVNAAKSTRALAPEVCFSGALTENNSFPAASNAPLNSTGAERKIGAIGIHVARGITTHGFAFNVSTDLRDFQLIVPCGIADHAVTSLDREMKSPGNLPSLEIMAHEAARQFGLVFGEQVLALESLEALRTQAEANAAARPGFPAQDTPMQVPAEVERLRHNEDRPIRA